MVWNKQLYKLSPLIDQAVIGDCFLKSLWLITLIVGRDTLTECVLGEQFHCEEKCLLQGELQVLVFNFFRSPMIFSIVRGVIDWKCITCYQWCPAWSWGCPEQNKIPAIVQLRCGPWSGVMIARLVSIPWCQYYNCPALPHVIMPLCHGTIHSWYPAPPVVITLWHGMYWRTSLIVCSASNHSLQLKYDL